MKDYYKILEIVPSATLIDIKRAYRKLSFKYHPDQSKTEESAKEFILITEAYEVLRCPENRKEYDTLYKQIFEQNQDLTVRHKDKEKSWKAYGESKAQEYSSIAYEDLVARIYDEIKLAVGYTPNFIFILFCGCGVLTSFYLMVNINILYGLFCFLLYGGFCYALYERARKDYIAERKHKILNKYK